MFVGTDSCLGLFALIMNKVSMDSICQVLVLGGCLSSLCKTNTSLESVSWRKYILNFFYISNETPVTHSLNMIEDVIIVIVVEVTFKSANNGMVRR